MARLRRASGFTLTEMMVCVAILSIIFSIGPDLMKNVQRFTRLNRARLDTLQRARDTLSMINQVLRQASSSSITVSQESGQPPFSNISFTTVDGRHLKFYQSGNNLMFVHANSTATVADGLRYIAFTYPRTDSSSIVSVSLTYEKNTYESQTKALQMAIEKVRIMNN